MITTCSTFYRRLNTQELRRSQSSNRKNALVSTHTQRRPNKDFTSTRLGIRQSLDRLARKSMTGGRQAQCKETAQNGSGETINVIHKSPIPSFSSLFFLTTYLRPISIPIRVSLCSITSRFAASTCSIFAMSF